MKHSTQGQLVRFLIVGVSTVLIDFVIYTILVNWLQASFAKGISFLCGTVYAYQINRTWTFAVGGASTTQFVKFLAVYGINLWVNVFVNNFALGFLGDQTPRSLNIAFIAATGTSAALNFIGMKFLVFRKRENLQSIDKSTSVLGVDAMNLNVSNQATITKTLSIILPCYNESGNIPLILDRFAHVIMRNDVEVILVDNGSQDDSPEVLQALLPKYPFARSVRVDVNQGYGFGIISGLLAAEGRYLGWTHADMQTDPRDVIQALEILEKSKNPAKTYIKGLRKGRSFSDRFFTIGMSFFTSLLLGVPLWDVNAQPNIFPREFFLSWKSPPYDFSLDLYCYYIAIKNKWKLVRFSVNFGERIHGVSHWNIDWKSKTKFIKRTVDFTFELKKRLSRQDRQAAKERAKSLSNY